MRCTTDGQSAACGLRALDEGSRVGPRQAARAGLALVVKLYSPGSRFLYGSAHLRGNIESTSQGGDQGP